MNWQDFFAAHESWDDDAIERNMPSSEEMKSAAVDEVYEVIENIADADLLVAFVKNALAAGIIFTTGQVVEMLFSLPKGFASELFLLYCERMNGEELDNAEGQVDDTAYQKGLRAWATVDRPVTWTEYYEDGQNNLPEEIIVLRLDRLTAYGPIDEVYDLAVSWFTDEVQCGVYVDKALATGIRFNLEQTIELMYSVTRETAGRLYWACGKKLSADDLCEIEDLVDEDVFAHARSGTFFTREPIEWDDFVGEAEEWDDDVKLHKASCLTSFGDADEVAEAAELFADKKMAARFVEMAIRSGVKFDPAGRKVGFFEGLLQVVGAVLIADWIFGKDKSKSQRGVDRPDVFGCDYNSIFGSESARDEYYRRVRQKRYESGRARDEFEPIK
jgi:hypothetical protein